MKYYKHCFVCDKTINAMFEDNDKSVICFCCGDCLTKWINHCNFHTNDKIKVEFKLDDKL